MTTSILKLSYPCFGDEYYDAADRIAEVFQKHFAQTETRRLLGIAYHFMGLQQTFEKDFWTKGKVMVSLEELPRLLAKVRVCYDKIPEMVKDELLLEADCHHQRAIEEFKKTKDMFLVSELPGPVAKDALKALTVVVEQSSKIAEVVATVKRELPAGMPTVNRPGDAYSVIHGAREIWYAQKGKAPPNSIDSSGPFYRLLVDLFALFGLTTSVSGAYRGWIKNIGTNYEHLEDNIGNNSRNLDLIPI